MHAETRPSFRRRTLAALGALAVVGGAAVAPLPGLGTMFWSRLADAGHYPVFAALTWLVYRAFAARRSHLPSMGLAAVTTLGLAGTIEAVQPAFGRDASWIDGVNGFLGIALTLLGVALWRRPVHAVPRLLHATAFVAVQIVVLQPALIERSAMQWRERNFPLLADFEDDRELPLWSPRDPGTAIAIVERHATSGSRALEVRVPEGARGTVNYDAGNADWTGQDELRFDVFNARERFRLTLLGLDDSGRADVDGRFTGRFWLENGPNEIRIPLARMARGGRDRPLNLGGIVRLLLVFEPDPGGRELYFDRFRLEASNGTAAAEEGDPSS